MVLGGFVPYLGEKVKTKVFLHSIQQNKIQVKELNISKLKP